MEQVRSILFHIVSFFAYADGIIMSIVIALQTNKSEGLGAVLAGGGGGGGKVGKDRGLDKSGLYLAYAWLILVALQALLRP